MSVEASMGKRVVAAAGRMREVSLFCDRPFLSGNKFNDVLSAGLSRSKKKVARRVSGQINH
jgi:hypothetical protein